MKSSHVSIRCLLHLAILTSVVTFISGCKNSVEYVTVYKSCDCPDPLLRGNGDYREPSTYYLGGGISSDLKTQAYLINGPDRTLNLLDLRTGTTTEIPLRNILPDTSDWGSAYLSSFLWCPYDAKKIALCCVGFFDTTGMHKTFTESRDNMYIYDIVTQRCIRVTPPGYGNFGSESGFGARAWLKGSEVGVDSFLTYLQIYVPQQDSFYSVPNDYAYRFSQSPDGHHLITSSYTGSPDFNVYLDGKRLQTSHYMGRLTGISWSPSGDKIAFEVTPSFITSDSLLSQFGPWDEVWIFDVKKYLSTGIESVYRINFQDHFCKYSFLGIDPQYITDSTLSVSMHADGDAVSDLWEITDDGKIVRQLTH